MAADHEVMGLFTAEDAAAAALTALLRSGWPVKRVYSPVPSHRIAEALNVKTSRVGYFTLAGGIIGFFTGFLLAIFTASQWHLTISGKPVIALVPFFIVGFEFTILFAVFGNVVGLIHQTGLPAFKGLDRYDARCSGEHYGVLTACTPEQRGDLIALLKNQGAEIKVFDDDGRQN